MHRSGTSALSRVVNLLGATPPKNLLHYPPHNERGHWESVSLLELHETFLGAVGSYWDDWRSIDPARLIDSAARPFSEKLKKIIESEYGNSPLFFIKDPRICRLMPFWMAILHELNIKPFAVISLRNPLEVAMSLQRRDGFGQFRSQLIWLRHVLEAEFLSRQLPRTFVQYEKMLADWRTHLLPGIARVGAAWPALTRAMETEIDQFLSPELRHENATFTDLSAHPDIISWVVETYDVLLKLADDDGNPKLFAKLDATRTVFDEACRAFGDILRMEELVSEQQRALATELAEEGQAQQARIAELEHEESKRRTIITRLNNELSERDAEIGRLSQLAREQDVIATKLNVELELMKNSTSWWLTKPLRKAGTAFSRLARWTRRT